MKIDRLIGILSVLLQQDKVTAPYLADRFEVSRRTINRDIEDLCKAGIPVATAQGKNGGISIMEGYCIDKTLLTTAEMQMILTGLQSLDGVLGTNHYRQLINKLSPSSGELPGSNQYILMNLTSWYSGALVSKIELIQGAIQRKHFIVFNYFSPSGEGYRKIEPYLLIFQWSSWYVWGYCSKRKEFRMFKLNRTDSLEETSESYEKRDIPLKEIEVEIKQPGTAANWKKLEITAAFSTEVKWRLIEEFGVGCYKEGEDGRLYMTFNWSEEASLYSFILSFGEDAELIRPVEMRDKLKSIAENITGIYKHDI